MKWFYIGLGIVAAFALTVIIIGLLLPVKHIASASKIYNATPEKIWVLIITIAEYPSWRRELKGVEILDKKSWKEIDNYGKTITYKIIESKRNEKLITRIVTQDLPFGGSWTFQLKALPAGTQLKITENGEVYNPFFRFISRFFMGHDYTIKRYLHHLRKRVLEH